MPSTSSAANLVLIKLLTGSGYNPTGTWYVGLSTQTIQSDGTGVSEPTSGSYYRIAIDSNFWNPPENSTITNGCPITFHTATQKWGTIKEIFISNTNTLGTSGSYIFFHQPLIPSIPVNTGTRVIIPPESLIIKRDSRAYERG